MKLRAAAPVLAALLLAGCAAKTAPLARLPLPPPEAAYAPEITSNPCKPGATPVLINYATDRAPAKTLDKIGSQRFTGDRSFEPNAEASPRRDLMAFGHAIACLAPEHQRGDAKTVSVGIVATPSDTAARWLGGLGNQSASDAGRVLIYVHGYNNSFEEAISRAARLKADLGFKGPVVAYSWPSRGSISAFLPDLANAHFTEVHFRALLAMLPREGGDVAVIAHSLGNQIVTTTLANLEKGDVPGIARLREVIMAAPAVDSDYLRMKIAPAMTARLPGTRFTLYASSRDKAMSAILSKSGSSNAGDGNDLFVLPPIQTIDATAIKNGLIGHSYFVDSPPVLDDIKAIVGSHAAPGSAERGLQARATCLWAFPDAERPEPAATVAACVQPQAR